MSLREILRSLRLDADPVKSGPKRKSSPSSSSAPKKDALVTQIEYHNDRTQKGYSFNARSQTFAEVFNKSMHAEMLTATPFVLRIELPVEEETYTKDKKGNIVVEHHKSTHLLIPGFHFGLNEIIADVFGSAPDFLHVHMSDLKDEDSTLYGYYCLHKLQERLSERGKKIWPPDGPPIVNLWAEETLPPIRAGLLPYKDRHKITIGRDPIMMDLMGMKGEPHDYFILQATDTNHMILYNLQDYRRYVASITAGPRKEPRRGGYLTIDFVKKLFELPFDDPKVYSPPFLSLPHVDDGYEDEVWHMTKAREHILRDVQEDRVNQYIQSKFPGRTPTLDEIQKTIILDQDTDLDAPPPHQMRTRDEMDRIAWHIARDYLAHTSQQIISSIESLLNQERYVNAYNEIEIFITRVRVRLTNALVIDFAGHFVEDAIDANGQVESYDSMEHAPRFIDTYIDQLLSDHMAVFSSDISGETFRTMLEAVFEDMVIDFVDPVLPGLDIPEPRYLDIVQDMFEVVQLLDTAHPIFHALGRHYNTFIPRNILLNRLAVWILARRNQNQHTALSAVQEETILNQVPYPSL